MKLGVRKIGRVRWKFVVVESGSFWDGRISMTFFRAKISAGTQEEDIVQRLLVQCIVRGFGMMGRR